MGALQVNTTNARDGEDAQPRVQEFIHSPAADAAAPRTADAAPVRAAAKVLPVEWHGNRRGCIVNVFAKARLAWLRNPGEPMRLGLLVTTNGDIHNPHVFQAIDVNFSVDVLVDGVKTDEIQHNLFAPAVLDPRGSDQWYVWNDEADDVDSADLTDLSRISLEINI